MFGENDSTSLGLTSYRCTECNGTGISNHINSDDPKCRACDGTGMRLSSGEADVLFLPDV